MPLPRSLPGAFPCMLPLCIVPTALLFLVFFATHKDSLCLEHQNPHACFWGHGVLGPTLSPAGITLQPSPRQPCPLLICTQISTPPIGTAANLSQLPAASASTTGSAPQHLVGDPAATSEADNSSGPLQAASEGGGHRGPAWVFQTPYSNRLIA